MSDRGPTPALATCYWPDWDCLSAFADDAVEPFWPYLKALALARFPETFIMLMDGEEVLLDELEPSVVERLGFRR